MTVTRSTRIALALGWVAVVLVLCLIPGQEVPDSRLFEMDKLGHFGMFFVGGLLALWAWPERVGAVVAAGLAMAVLTEGLQGLLPIGRSADVLDAVADVAGLLAGLGLFLALRRRAVAA